MNGMDETAGDGLLINLCCGPVRLPGYVNVDFSGSDLDLDLDRRLLPFPDASARVVVFISAINYFSRQRGLEILKDIRRVLAVGGVLRVGVQDLHLLTQKYLERDEVFYFQKLSDGRDRFPGSTFADKLNTFFSGFAIGEKRCRYVYDAEALLLLCHEAGFRHVAERGYRDSAILGIEHIDNRPEQMFFLEAVRGSDEPVVECVPLGEEPAARLFAEARHLLLLGRTEKAWQNVLACIDHAPGDEEALALAANISLEANLPGEALKICALGKTLAAHSQRLALIAEKAGLAVLPEVEAAAPLALDALDRVQRSARADAEHLARAMGWLRAAREQSCDRGHPACYHMTTKRFGPSYPETTGYIIPTFLAYGRLSGDARWTREAREMGDWEAEIQSPLGGAGEPAGIFNIRPRVFNTGQVLLGWLALLRIEDNPSWRNAAVRAGDFILRHLEADGKWTRYTYSGPRIYKSRVAWALLELHAVSGDVRYRLGAERAVRWILGKINSEGPFANISLGEPGMPWTHLTGYLLFGLLKIWKLSRGDLDHDAIMAFLRQSARSICASVTPESMARLHGLPGRYGAGFTSRDAWSCLTGNAQIALFLNDMAEITGEEALGAVSGSLVEELKKCQIGLEGADPGMEGGLAGSHPVGAQYCAYAIPNWGTKFFADCLLRKCLPADAEQNLLG